MKIYLENSNCDSHKRVWKAFGELAELNRLPYELLTEKQKHRRKKLDRIFRTYDLHIPVNFGALEQWQQELAYHHSTYAEIFKSMIRVAKICTNMNSRALSRIKSC